MVVPGWLAARQARESAIPVEDRRRNAASHEFGTVDDCVRCVWCEILPTNAWKDACSGRY